LFILANSSPCVISHSTCVGCPPSSCCWRTISCQPRNDCHHQCSCS
jgi:hypothetical protein